MARQPTFAVHISLTVSLKNVYSDLAERLLIYVIDSLPVAVGANIRIRRSKIYTYCISR
jgi:hypothetical protein